MSDSGAPFEISLHLASPDELFVAPDVNPLKRKGAYQSGVDCLYSRLRAGRNSSAKVRAVLYLPPDQIEPGLEQKVNEALLDYCQYKIGESRDELKFEHLLTLRLFKILLLALVVSVVVIAAGAYSFPRTPNPRSGR